MLKIGQLSPLLEPGVHSYFVLVIIIINNLYYFGLKRVVHILEKVKYH